MALEDLSVLGAKLWSSTALWRSRDLKHNGSIMTMLHGRARGSLQGLPGMVVSGVLAKSSSVRISLL